MKKILAFMLASVMLLSSTGCSAKNEATNETANNGTVIEIDGQAKSLIAYNINNNNYFKLRDVANVLKDTDAKFDVIWNEEKQAIELISDTSYSTNEEISTEKIEGATPVRAFPPIYLDGAEILLTAYSIADNNYFKLRDLASAIDFGVNYDAERGIIIVDTKAEYVFPEASGTDFAINPKYLSLIGKTKAYIDKKFGSEGEWWPEYNGIYYENVGVNIYYDTVMLEEPTSSSVAKGIDLDLNDLFFNCPAKPTAEQIQALFPASHIGFDYMNNENKLYTNYNGKELNFGSVSNLSSNSIAILTGNPYRVADPIPTPPATTSPKFEGEYADGEGSEVKITFDGTNYVVEQYIVRVSNTQCTTQMIDDYTLTYTDWEDQTFLLKMNDDYSGFRLSIPKYEQYGGSIWNFKRTS